MSESILSTVTTGKKRNPAFIILYGVDGVGKNTFASQAPNPIFITAEEKGSDHLNVTRTPPVKSLGDLGRYLAALAKDKHDYQTVVLDSLDWIEPLIWAQVCTEGKVDSIEKYDGGYGKGFTRAQELWRRLLENYLMPLAPVMNIILIAHAQIRTFADPAQPTGYDRYQLKLNEKSAAVLREAVECVLFATYETTVVKEKGDKKGRGVGDGERVVFTERRPAFDAKNHFDLPFELPLNWKSFSDAVNAYYTKPETEK